MPRAFLSYARSAATEVEALAKDLADLKHEVWFDASIGVGDAWWDHILREIRECDCFVLCLSQDWRDSKPCELEWEYSQALGKPAIMVRVDPDFDHKELPPALAIFEYLDYAGEDAKTAYKKLATTLEGLDEAPPLPEPLPETPAPPISELSLIYQRIKEEPLSPDEQDSLILDLRRRLENPDEAEAAQKLLDDLGRRKDITAHARDLDAALARGPVRRKKSVKERLGSQGLWVVRDELARLGVLKDELEHCFDSIKLSTDFEISDLAAIEERLKMGRLAGWGDEEWKSLGLVLKKARKRIRDVESRLNEHEEITSQVSDMSEDLKVLTLRVGKMGLGSADEDGDALEVDLHEWLNNANAEAAPDLAKECTERTKTRLRAMQEAIDSLSKALVLPEVSSWGSTRQGSGSLTGSSRPVESQGRRPGAKNLRELANQHD